VLPKSVFEEPSFGYNEDLAKQCFDLSVQIRLDDFLRVILSDKAPSCFIWINVFHRFTLVQNVVHPISCNVCDRTHFNGFRYKCQKCRKYQMCQDCFWRGRVSNAHHLTHQMKEYTNYVSYLILKTFLVEKFVIFTVPYVVLKNSFLVGNKICKSFMEQNVIKNRLGII